MAINCPECGTNTTEKYCPKCGFCITCFENTASVKDLLMEAHPEISEEKWDEAITKVKARYSNK